MDQKTILIIDDTPENIDLLAGILKPIYTVKAARAGKIGLKIAASPKPPQLILLDIKMPEMDGFEVCEQLKANPDTASIPIILLSADIGNKEKERGAQFGVNGYLVKPFNVDELLSTVAMLLSD